MSVTVSLKCSVVVAVTRGGVNDATVPSEGWPGARPAKVTAGSPAAGAWVQVAVASSVTLARPSSWTGATGSAGSGGSTTRSGLAIAEAVRAGMTGTSIDDLASGAPGAIPTRETVAVVAPAGASTGISNGAAADPAANGDSEAQATTGPINVV